MSRSSGMWPGPPARPVAAPPPPPPVMVVAPPPLSFTTADLAAACDQGREEGLQAARHADAARAARALEEIAARLLDADAAAADIARRAADSLAAVLLAAVTTAFPGLESRLGPAEAAGLLAAILPGLSREPEVTVRAAPGAAAAIAAHLASLPAPARGRVILEVDEGLGEADLRVAWRDGAAIRDAAAIREGVLAALAALADAGAAEGNAE